MTVAITVAAVVMTAARRVKREIAIGRGARRLRVWVEKYRGKRARGMERKTVRIEVRKRANIQWDAVRTRESAEAMLAGRATMMHISWWVSGFVFLEFNDRVVYLLHPPAARSARSQRG